MFLGSGPKASGRGKAAQGGDLPRGGGRRRFLQAPFVQSLPIGTLDEGGLSGRLDMPIGGLLQFGVMRLHGLGTPLASRSFLFRGSSTMSWNFLLAWRL